MTAVCDLPYSTTGVLTSGILPCVAHAVSALAAPGCRVLPARLRVVAQVCVWKVCLPRLLHVRHVMALIWMYAGWAHVRDWACASLQCVRIWRCV